ncbi:MAG: hypothetical protein COY40_04575 [Alphaproteobacteria bacterium CG_4_10_14_0_8_um_filter_53_9]|nr:MAG: hypothetical protein COY40_04575 [Alphaproteobacteria bacterium CG_4_10_14_0_8_um_filter_53_9]
MGGVAQRDGAATREPFHVRQKRLRCEALVRFMAVDEGLVRDYGAMAAAVGVSVHTVKQYLRGDFWDLVDAEKARRAADPLATIDDAMLAAARKGNVAAARLVYDRVRGREMPDDDVDVEALLAELKEVVGRK